MKTSAKFVRIIEELKHSTASRVFTDLLLNSPKRSHRFSPGYEGTENMFYFLNDHLKKAYLNILVCEDVS